jgi:hypothetical protein
MDKILQYRTDYNNRLSHDISDVSPHRSSLQLVTFLTKSTTLRINLNIDASPVPPASNTHPSHPGTSHRHPCLDLIIKIWNVPPYDRTLLMQDVYPIYNLVTSQLYQMSLTCLICE